MTCYTRFQTELGEIILAGDEMGLSHLHINGGKRSFEIDENWPRNDELFNEARKQIEEFLCGQRKKFDLQLNPAGTEFQRKVWQALTEIPYGQTISYAELAAAIGSPKAARAVGMANSRNPIPLIIPCHRVVGAGGKLTGFALGLKIKKQLLELER